MYDEYEKKDFGLNFVTINYVRDGFMYETCLSSICL